MTEQERFEQECQDFSDALYLAANWKNSFFGASYRTRLHHAIDHARTAASKLEAYLTLPAGQSPAQTEKQ